MENILLIGLVSCFSFISFYILILIYKKVKQNQDEYSRLFQYIHKKAKLIENIYENEKKIENEINFIQEKDSQDKIEPEDLLKEIQHFTKSNISNQNKEIKRLGNENPNENSETNNKGESKLNQNNKL